MIILKFFLAIVGLAVITISIINCISGLTGELGFIFGLIGAAIVFLVFGRENVSEFFGITNSLLDSIAFGAMIGGGILCSMEFEKIGSAVVTAGWVAIGLILIQVIPIPFIANIIEIASMPFTIACVPLLLILLIFI